MNSYENIVINNAFRTDELTENDCEYIKQNYTVFNRERLIAIAKKKKVLPIIGKLMCALNIDKTFWSEHYYCFLKRNREVVSLLTDLFRSFYLAGVERVCVYENFGALLASDNDIALYSSGDVDLLASSEEKARIDQVMRAFGYIRTKDIQDKRTIVTEYTKEEGIIRINVAWIPLLRFALPISVPSHSPFDWATVQKYKDTPIVLPSNESILYLCLIRIAVHGYSRSPDVRLYIDIQNAVCTNPNWDTVIAWAKADGVLTKIVTVAYIANRLNGVAVPNQILEMAQADPYAQKIIRIAYDEENRTLKYDPTGIELLKLEAASDNKSVVGEVMTILFPPVRWVKDFYTEQGDSIWKAYWNYYKRFIGR